MIDFMTWLWATKKIKAKDIHWYEITKLFEEYKRLIKEEGTNNANGRKKKV